jgi:hypothetical protein
MNVDQAYRQYFDIRSATARDYTAGVREEQGSCYTDLQQIAADAENQFRGIYETYLQELRAASAGDDAIQRAGAAHRNFQREYARIQGEYFKASQDRCARMTETMGTLTANVYATAMDGWIECLRELRRTVVAAAPSGKSGEQ